MSFVLTPPVILENDLGFSVLQADDMDGAESLVITMAGWSALDLLKHWRYEIGECLALHRNRCCIVSGLAIKNRKVIPSEWWNLYVVGNKVKLQYQVLSTENPYNWENSATWWKHISMYKLNSGDTEQRVSEWTVAMNDLSIWCKQCDTLLQAIAVSDGEGV
jgi:hypothetical protein